jgi:hypothetical protein
MNTWLNPDRKSYFWRNYNQSEVDYIEIDNHEISAFEMKWNTRKKHRVSKAFTNQYPNASTEIISPKNMMKFTNGE